MLRKKCWWLETKPTLSIQKIVFLILFTDKNVEEEMLVVGNKTNSFYSEDYFIYSTGRCVLRVLCCISRQACG